MPVVPNPRLSATQRQRPNGSFEPTTSQGEPHAVPTPPWPLDRLGMEFEGAWNANRRSTFQNHHGEVHADRWHVHGDGSVNSVYGNWHSGEIVTTPLSSWEAVDRAIDDGWPDDVNQTCGFHVHCSFITANYSRLVEEGFWRWFTAYWDNVLLQPPAVWTDTDLERLRARVGGGRFCQREFIPKSQMYQQGKGGNRYTQLNYCFGHLKTIECRLLPMFETKEGAKAAVRLLLTCYQTFLAREDDNLSVVEAWEGDPEVPCERDFVKEFMVMAVEPETVFATEINSVLHAETVESIAVVHPDFLRRPPPGTMKMLELGTSEPRAVRDRVRALIRRFSVDELAAEVDNHD